MASPRNAELTSVGPDEIVVTFSTDGDDPVVTRIGAEEFTTRGPHHVVRAIGLEPSTEHPIDVDGAEPGTWLPLSTRTLDRPPGRLVATFATANDVHFGETRCGITGFAEVDAVGPILMAEPGDDPYPEVMNRAVVAEIAALAPDVVVVKGDLTDQGSEEEYTAFLAAYGVLGDRMFHVRGNHDAMIDPSMAIEDAPYTVDLEGVTIAVLDTVNPGTDAGRLDAEQVRWLDDLATERAGPVIVLGHHHCWNVDGGSRAGAYFGIQPDDSEALVATFVRNDNLVAYSAGHTHTNRVRRFASTGARPFGEVASTKEFPGAWAEYQVYEGGFTQVMRRVMEPEAFAWAQKTRALIQGAYTDLVFGGLEHRCFTQLF
ncbi:MAG TPA: metallophosphoesterase [Acidimicrobiia bacterium]|nr:metallophosphoesterase [Acidimicrobiia bacterium]